MDITNRGPLVPREMLQYFYLCFLQELQVHITYSQSSLNLYQVTSSPDQMIPPRSYVRVRISLSSTYFASAFGWKLFFPAQSVEQTRISLIGLDEKSLRLAQTAVHTKCSHIFCQGSFQQWLKLSNGANSEQLGKIIHLSTHKSFQSEDLT